MVDIYTGIFECCCECALQLEINLFCFIVNSVIEEDLAPWKNGITEEVFNTAKSNNYGSHYQIVNHKLYREEGCMFPARCVPVLVHYLHVTAACTHTVLVVSYLSRVHYSIKNWYKLCRSLTVGSVRGHTSFILFHGYMLYVSELHKKIHFNIWYVEYARNFLLFFILNSYFINSVAKLNN